MEKDNVSAFVKPVWSEHRSEDKTVILWGISLAALGIAAASGAAAMIAAPKRPCIIVGKETVPILYHQQSESVE